MVVEPEKYFDGFAGAGANGMTIHAEAAPHLAPPARAHPRARLPAGVALNPATPLERSREVAAELDLLLVMTVNPGFGGQTFIAHSVDKVAPRAAAARRATEPAPCSRWTAASIARHDRRVWRAGADTFVAGNAVFTAPDPRAEIAALRALCAERGMTVRQQWTIVARDRRRARRRARSARRASSATSSSRARGVEGAAVRGGDGRFGAAARRRRSPTTRAGGAAQHLGDLVRALPRGDAEHRELHRRSARRGCKIVAVSMDDPGIEARSATSRRSSG